MATLQEKLEAIAVYAGWLVIPEGTYIECHKHTIWFGHGGKYDCYHDIHALSELKYLTSLDWLHPVAMKVVDELIKISKENATTTDAAWAICKLASKIRMSCGKKPNSNGEYTDLFNAVYEGILFINQYKINEQCK